MRDAADLAGFAFRRPQSDLRADAFKRAIGRHAFKGALPDYYQVPAAISPCRFVAAVAVDVLRPFPHPEGDVRLRHCRVLAPVPVPKASSHVDDCSCLGDYNVRFAFKPPVAHPEPPTRSEQPFADKRFRLRVLPANLRHQTAALFCGHRIHISQFFASAGTARLYFSRAVSVVSSIVFKVLCTFLSGGISDDSSTSQVRQHAQRPRVSPHATD